jgi:hypothetical protein
MATYSYLKLEAFRNCPEGYKYFTIDEMIPIDGMIPMERGLNLRFKSPRLHFAGSSLGSRTRRKISSVRTPYEQRRITISKLKEGDFI